MTILVVNSGSSSLKFQVLCLTPGETVLLRTTVLRGAIRGIGGDATLTMYDEHHECTTRQRKIAALDQALDWMLTILADTRPSTEHLPWLSRIEAVGHRVVHGGDTPGTSLHITERNLHNLEQLAPLAPLHNPACIRGIIAVGTALPDIPMVAVFDTGFHRTLPVAARTYAIPHAWTKRYHIRRYGFHGLAHQSLAEGYVRAAPHVTPEYSLVTFQLGHGCSAAATRGGRSIETSMGFTPLEGLVMGTRSGDVDPALIPYLAARLSIPHEDVVTAFNRESGLLGLSGHSAHMDVLLRRWESEQDPRAGLAIDVFCHRAKHYLGAYLALLNGADAIVFGGGIGEAAPQIRSRICADMTWCGIDVDEARNQQVTSMAPGEACCISTDSSAVAIYVIGTDEEGLIAQETFSCLQPTADDPSG